MNSEERTAQAAEFYIHRLWRQYDELGARTYPTGQTAVQCVIALIAGLLETAEKSLSSTSKNPLTAEKIGDAYDCAREAYLLMQLLEGSDVSELDYAAVGPMQRWFDELVQPTRTIFFRAEHVANYEIRTRGKANYSGIRKKSNSLSKAISSIKWPLTRITVPSKALSILPHFAIVAHEIGHAIYRDTTDKKRFQSFVNQQLANKKNIIDQANSDFVTNVKNQLGNAYKDSRVASIKNQILYGLAVRPNGGWHEEIAADAIAFALTGPAIFFALSDMLFFASSTNLYGQTHPPTVLRRKLLFGLLNRDPHNFVNSMDKKLGITLTENFNNSLITPLRPSGSLYIDFCRTNAGPELASILANLPKLVEVTGTLIADAVQVYFDQNYATHRYSIEKFESDIDEHLDSLLSGIPPIEIGRGLKTRKPTDFASVLNIGWMALLCRSREFLPNLKQKSLADGARAESLHRLLIKAVELAEIKRRWKEI